MFSGTLNAPLKVFHSFCNTISQNIDSKLNVEFQKSIFQDTRREDLLPESGRVIIGNHHYDDRLLKLAGALRFDSPLSLIEETEQHYVTGVDFVGAKVLNPVFSNQAIHNKKSKNRKVRLNDGAQVSPSKKSFPFGFSLNGISGIVHYVLGHPLEAMTTVLATQSIVTTAFSASPSIMPAPSSSSFVNLPLSKMDDSLFKLPYPEEFFKNSVLKEYSLSETSHFAQAAFTDIETSKGLSKSSPAFQVNTYSNGRQERSSVAALVDGGFVVTWASYDQDGSDFGVYAQRYDGTGVPFGNEFRVNTYVNGVQNFPAVAGLVDGGFVVTWSSYDQDGSEWGIYAQRYNATGVAFGNEFRVNTYVNSNQVFSTVAGLFDGSFVMSWQSEYQDGSGYGVYAQRYDVAGVAIGNEFRVNTYTNNQQASPKVASLASGGFVVTWQSYDQDVGSGLDIYAQRYNAAGVTLGNEFRVNTYRNDYQASSTVAALVDGGFVVTWQSEYQDGSGWGIYAQRYDATGVALGNEFQVNTSFINSQLYPSVASLTNGGFVVTWMGGDPNIGNFKVYGQRYDATGNILGNEFQINSPVEETQRGSSVAGLRSGGFVVTYNSMILPYVVYGQIYEPSPSSTATLSSSITITASSTTAPSVSSSSTGSISGSETGSISASGTVSHSGSLSGSATAASSISSSKTGSASASETGSASISGTVSPSGSESNSGTVAPSVSSSGSESVSVSETGSSSSSWSRTMTTSVTREPSVSGTVELSASTILCTQSPVPHVTPSVTQGLAQAEVNCKIATLIAGMKATGIWQNADNNLPNEPGNLQPILFSLNEISFIARSNKPVEAARQIVCQKYTASSSKRRYYA